MQLRNVCNGWLEIGVCDQLTSAKLKVLSAVTEPSRRDSQTLSLGERGLSILEHVTLSRSWKTELGHAVFTNAWF